MRGMPPQAHATTLQTAAVAIAVVSGICALVALAAGSPLQFGVALAVFGSGWIAADFIGSTVARERERAAQRCAFPAARLNAGYGSSRIVCSGGGDHFPRTAPRTQSRLAA